MTILEITEKLKNGNREDIKLAHKELDKFWHRTFQEKDLKKEIEKFLLDGIIDFNKIEKALNKEGFVSAMKLPMLSFGRKHYDLCRDFILRILESEDGHLRQQAIFTGEYLHMSFQTYSSLNEKPSKEFLEDNEKREKMLVDFIKHLFELSRKYHFQAKRIKYINRLKPCIYKSVQIFLDNFLSSDYTRSILDKHKFGCVDIKPDKILPQIKLKYYRKNKEPACKDLKCDYCGKIGINIGATTNAYSNRPKYMCEDCAIDRYKDDLGYESRKAAEARRRRIFDVGYLLQEMITDRYLAEYNIKSVDDLEEGVVGWLFEMGNNLYNEFFSKKEKIRLEEIERQEDLAKELEKAVKVVKFN